MFNAKIPSRRFDKTTIKVSTINCIVRLTVALDSQRPELIYVRFESKVNSPKNEFVNRLGSCPSCCFRNRTITMNEHGQSVDEINDYFIIFC